MFTSTFTATDLLKVLCVLLECPRKEKMWFRDDNQVRRGKMRRSSSHVGISSNDSVIPFVFFSENCWCSVLFTAEDFN